MCLIGNNWTRPCNNYNSHSMGNWENLDSILDNIKFIINFLRYNNNVMVMYTEKCPHSQELHAKIFTAKILYLQFAVKGSVQKKKVIYVYIEREKANTVKC